MKPRARQSGVFHLGFLGVVILIGAQAFESTRATSRLKPKGGLPCLAAAGMHATSFTRDASPAPRSTPSGSLRPPA